MTGREDSAEWFEHWFDEDYLALYAHRNATEACRFVRALWTGLELTPGVTVADVPCGTGRHSLAFAERGARVVGLDLSSAMLARAAESAAPMKSRPLFVRGDLRRIPLTGGFQLVANIFTSIGYFEREEDNRAVFSELARLLTPGGMLVLDVINPVYLRRHFVAETRRDTEDGDVIEWRELDVPRHRVLKCIQIRHGSAVRMIRESVQLYELAELERLSAAHGLRPVYFWGDYDGREFTGDSPRLILFARK